MDSTHGRIAAVGTAIPDYRISQEEALCVIKRCFEGALTRGAMGLADRVFAHPSVRTRHLAVSSPDELVNEDPDVRIGRFTRSAVRLSCEASLSALEKAGIKTKDVSALVVNTCTGYICPGISTYVVEKLGLRRDIPAYDLVGAGCAGAVPNLLMSRTLLNRGADSIALSISVEICSAAFQMDDDPALIVSNAIFGDGASACVLWSRPQGLALIDSALIHAPEHREKIRFIHRNGRLTNQLSSDLPEVAGKVVARLVSGLLKKNGLSCADVKHWALHGGGDAVINSVKAEIGLSEPQVKWARKVLSEYGNISSPSAIFALRDILDSGVAADDWCIIVAFGAGMSAYACLLRKTG